MRGRARLVSFLLAALCLLLSACGQNTEAKWQEQYDLGVRYLSEGNYEEAIIAFTAAIEIDPNRAEAYVGRGDAYIGSGETEENLVAALADYEEAVALDETNVAAWLGLADVYIRQGDYDKALQVLQEGLNWTDGDKSIVDKIHEMERGVYQDSSNRIRRSNDYDLNGNLSGYTEYQYDDLGRRCGWTNYVQTYSKDGISEGIRVDSFCEVTFNEKNRPERNQFYASDGAPTYYDTFVYNSTGEKLEQYRYMSDGKLAGYFCFYYDGQGREIRYEAYNEEGIMLNYVLSEYDESGELIQETIYDPETNEIIGYSTVE